MKEQETIDFFFGGGSLFRAVVYANFIPVSKDQWSLLSVLMAGL